MSYQPEKCHKPCATCPFLRENFGKPNPPNVEILNRDLPEDQKINDWYSAENLKRLWSDGIRRGGVMLCHATDPTAKDYGGKEVAPGHERICVGSLAIVLQHVNFLQSLIEKGISKSEINRRYRSLVKYPMTKAGVFNWAMRYAIGRTSLTGGLQVPSSISGINDCAVTWRDEIVNKAEKKEVNQ